MECDLGLSANGRVVPIEDHARGVGALKSFLGLYPQQAQRSLLIPMHPRVERISRRVYNFPIGLLRRGSR